MSRLRRNWFLIGIVLAPVLGFLLPARLLSLNPGGVTTTIIVVVLFLITGLKLPTDQIGVGLTTPRLHLFLQLFIFVLTPVFFLSAALFFSQALDGRLLVGIYALAVLPTTVSSCIVFTQSTSGNAVAAIFNAALANTLGIVISPVLLSVLLQGSGQGLPPGHLISTLTDLAVKMLLPIVAGQIARVRLKTWVDHAKRALSTASNALILLIVLFAMAQTASNPEFLSFLPQLPWPFVYLALSHLILVGLTIGASRLLKLRPADQITALFVAPQKTLALGAPLLSVYFAGQEVLGVALLPLVFYHPWQLLVAGVLKDSPFVKRLAVQAEEAGR